MASVIADTLKLTFKLLVNKIRDKGADRLKHGDVTDEQFRDFIIRELADIREKLEGLCKTDLIASANFFKDGVSLLYQSFAKSGRNHPSIKKEVYKGDFDTISLVNTDTTNIELDHWEVLHLMTDGLQFDKIDTQDKFFVEAMNFFEKAADSATKAFSNEALDIYDRVLSMKFRVAATMLQHLSQPEVAVVLCKNYVEQLNGLPEVREAFSVRFGRFNMRRLFCEMRRDALISTTVSINRILWEHLYLCLKGDQVLRNWPEIPLNSSRRLHPVLSAEVARGYFWSFGEFGGNDPQLNGPVDLDVNSKGFFIVADRYNNQIKVFSRDGEMSRKIFDLAFVQTYNDDTAVTNMLHPQSVAVDKNDGVYICSSYMSPLSWQFVNEIIALNEGGDFRWSFGRGLHSFNNGKLTSITVDKCRERVFTLCESNVFVLNTEGGFLSSFTLIGEFRPALESHLCVTSKGNLIVTGLTTVFFISKRAANNTSYKTRSILPSPLIKPNRMVPSTFRPSGIAFDPHTNQIIVIDRATNSLMVFDTAGHFIRKTYFYEKYTSGGVAITRDGHVAVANRCGNKILIM